MLYWGYMLARVLARTMPLGLSYWIAERVADLWYISSPRTRANVAYNLSLVPGAPATGSARARLTRRMMHNFARVVTEFLYFPRFHRDNLERLVDLDSFGRIKEIMATGPAVLVTAHLGNWELAAATLAVLGIDLHVVVYDHPDTRVARLYRKRREGKGLKVMPVQQAARDITGVLRRASIGIVGDRDYSGRGSEARFLGVPIKVPSAYAGLAVALKAPVIVGFCVRQKDGRYRLSLVETAYDPPDDPKTAEEIIRTCLRAFEKGVEKYPEQWYFFEKVDRRWAAP